jgi:hypothetical protein
MDRPSSGLIHTGAARLCLRGFLRVDARVVDFRAGRLPVALRRGFFPVGFLLVAIMARG